MTSQDPRSKIKDHSPAPKLDLGQWLQMLSPEGRIGLVAWFTDKRREYGADWLNDIKRDFPYAAWLVDLVANHTADQAIVELKKAYKWVPFGLYTDQIRSLHQMMREEIDKPR